MCDRYKDLTLLYLKGNQIADRLASEHLQPILPINQDNPFLPRYFLAYNNSSLDSQSIQSIYKLQIDQQIELAKQKNYKVLSWFFDPNIDQKSSTLPLVTQFEDFLHRATHNMLNAKTRLSYIATKPCPNGVPESKWAHLQKIYSDKNCHLCPDKVHNHEHVLSTCPLTIAVHDSLLAKMTDVLLKSCNNFSGIKPWFSTSTENASSNPQLMNGDKGLIPACFISSI